MNDQTQTPEEDDDIDPLAPLDQDDGDAEPLDPEAESLDGALSDHDRSLLSDEELAALDGEADDDDDGEQPEVADALEAETAAPATTDAPAQATAAPQTPADPGTPPGDDAINAADEGLKAAKEQQKTILTRYDDGEITAAERDEALAALTPEIGRHAAVLDAAQRHFEAQKTTFRDAAVAYLTEFGFLATDDHVTAFDRHVRQVTASPLSDGLSAREKLETAHRAYEAEVALYGKSLPMPAPKVQVGEQPKPQKTGKRELAPKPQAPVLLRNLPTSAATATSDGKYGQLQAAYEAIPLEDVAGRERFLARMSAEEREAFASMDA